MKIDPKYAFLLVILFVMSFLKFVSLTKNTPLFPILHVIAPLNDVRAYIAWSWKTTLIMCIFFYEDDIQLQIQVAPWDLESFDAPNIVCKEMLFFYLLSNTSRKYRSSYDFFFYTIFFLGS